jgi:hypothetical protein
MKFHVLYRTTGHENSKLRPGFYSKRIALLSFASTLSRVSAVGDVYFLCDGPVQDDQLRMMRSIGSIVTLPGLGNSGSYRRALAMFREASDWDDDDLVYFAEDDYLYQPDALFEIVKAAAAVPRASFFTPYDHPDYYALAAHLRYSRLHSRERWRVESQTWRSVRMTTMTFAARVGPMRTAAVIHELGSRGPYPRDWDIWSALVTVSPQYLVAKATRYTEVLVTRSMIRRAPEWLRRTDLLVAPRPSLATHLEQPFLARGVDWHEVARSLS